MSAVENVVRFEAQALILIPTWNKNTTLMQKIFLLFYLVRHAIAIGCPVLLMPKSQ